MAREVAQVSIRATATDIVGWVLVQRSNVTNQTGRFCAAARAFALAVSIATGYENSAAGIY